MHQPKVRINDLAREMEVKSRSILDALPLAGIFQKKTHSSSLDANEADKVRAYFQTKRRYSGQANTQKVGTTRAKEEGGAEIDLSHISRPGDVLRAITQRTKATLFAAPQPSISSASQPGVHPVRGQPIYRRLVQAESSVTTRPDAPAKPSSPKAGSPSGVSKVIMQRAKTPPASVAGSAISGASQPRVQPPRGQPIYRRLIPAQTSVSIRPAAPTERTAATARTSFPRVIMPHTGPRPVYTVRTTPRRMELGATTSERKIGDQSSIDEAEQALKILRAQEKQKPRNRDSE